MPNIGLRLAAPVAAGLLMATTIMIGPASAHHSLAIVYDISKVEIMAARLVGLDLINPHSWFHFEERRPDGTVANWAIEWLSPVELRRKGKSADEYFKVGEEFVVGYFPTKDGSGGLGHANMILHTDEVDLPKLHADPRFRRSQ